MPYDMIKVIREARKRRKQVLAWRNNGMKVQDIAVKLGVTKQRASAIIARARLD